MNFHKGSFHFGVYLCEGSQPKKLTESFCMNRFLRNNRILNSKVQWHCDPFDAIWNSQIWHTWVKDISIATFKVFIHVTTPNIACKRKDKFFCFSYSINRFDVHILNRVSDLFVFFARICDTTWCFWCRGFWIIFLSCINTFLSGSSSMKFHWTHWYPS